MKTCPVCRAGAFDDAEVCYGCLHRFSQGDAQAFVAPSVASAPNSSESGGAVGVDVACEGQGGARSREPASMHAESVRQAVAADAGNVLSDCGSAMRSSLKTVDVPGSRRRYRGAHRIGGCWGRCSADPRFAQGCGFRFGT